MPLGQANGEARGESQSPKPYGLLSNRLRQDSACRFKSFAGIIDWRAGAAGTARARIDFVASGISDRLIARRFVAGHRDRWRQHGRIETARFVLVTGLFGRHIAPWAAVFAAGPEPAPACAAIFPDKGVFGRFESRCPVLRIITGFVSGLGFLDWFYALRFGPLDPLGAFDPLRTFGAFRSLRPFGAIVLRPLVRLILAVRAIFRRILTFFAVAVAFLPALIAPRRALVVQAHAGIGNDAEIMVRELEVSFLLHPVTIEMRIMGHLTIFLKHLRRITTRTAVDPVQLLTTALRTVSTAAAAPIVIATIIAVTIVIVIQGCVFLNP